MIRLLQLGKTLVRRASTASDHEGAAFELDLSAPGSHKTSLVLGPSVTTIGPAICSYLDTLVQQKGLADGAFIFSPVAGHSQPHRASNWTRVVQRVFKRHAGIAVCPKDLRSSFVTWVKTEHPDNDTLQSAARALKHSTAMQSSIAYDKEKEDRVVAAATAVAERFASTFKAAPPPLGA